MLITLIIILLVIGTIGTTYLAGAAFLKWVLDGGGKGGADE